MDHIKTFFGGCIQARKRSKPPCHDSWLAPAPCPHHHQTSTPPKPLSKTPSIRIVASDPDDDDDSLCGPERRLRLSRFVDDEPANDDSTDEPQALPQPPTWATHDLPTTEVKSRRIEDIPEEDEGDDPTNISAARALAPAAPTEAQAHPRRRKSLVEIIHLLQSTTAAAVKGAAPGLAGRPLLRGTGSTAAGASTTSLPSLASSLSTHDTDSDDEVKRQRRVGAIVFPAAMRLRGWTEGPKKKRAVRPVTMSHHDVTGVDMEKKGGVFC